MTRRLTRGACFAFADDFAALRTRLGIELTLLAELLFRLNLFAADRAVIDNIRHGSSTQITINLLASITKRKHC